MKYFFLLRFPASLVREAYFFAKLEAEYNTEIDSCLLTKEIWENYGEKIKNRSPASNMTRSRSPSYYRLPDGIYSDHLLSSVFNSKWDVMSGIEMKTGWKIFLLNHAHWLPLIWNRVSQAEGKKNDDFEVLHVTGREWMEEWWIINDFILFNKTLISAVAVFSCEWQL